jgi:hypothetical protein
MNRRKKGNQILKARAKKANAKLSSKNKSKYISKAERETSTTVAAEDPNIVFNSDAKEQIG